MTFNKGKVHPRSGDEGPEGEQRYRFTLSSTSALDEVGGQRHAPAALPPRKTWYPLNKGLSGPLDRSGRVWKISPSSGFDPRSVQPVVSQLSRPHVTFNEAEHVGVMDFDFCD